MAVSEQLSDVLLTEALSGVATVTFTKKDNTVRVMRCTNNLALIPTEKHPTKATPPNPDVNRVYDLDINEWRSFRKSSILKIETGT